MSCAFVGVDLSLTSPAVCVLEGTKTLSFKACRFYFLTDKKKCVGLFGDNIVGSPQLPFDSPEQRYDQISDWVIGCLPPCARVSIEGYSFGSKSGRMFDIAENGGVLKHKLYDLGVPFEVFPPTSVKKFATGKGNADKLMMHDAFIKDTGIELHKILGVTPGTNPISDAVDAYFILKMGLGQL